MHKTRLIGQSIDRCVSPSALPTYNKALGHGGSVLSASGSCRHNGSQSAPQEAPLCRPMGTILLAHTAVKPKSGPQKSARGEPRSVRHLGVQNKERGGVCTKAKIVRHLGVQNIQGRGVKGDDSGQACQRRPVDPRDSDVCLFYIGRKRSAGMYFIDERQQTRGTRSGQEHEGPLYFGKQTEAAVRAPNDQIEPENPAACHAIM